MAQLTMIQAITEALRTELKNDENVLVLGKMLVLMEEFSVQRKIFKKNSVKIVYSIHLLLNLESVD